MFLKQKIVYLLVGILVGILISSSSALADDPIKIIINGSQLENATAILFGEHTYVPLRKVAEALNCNVKWDEKNNAVIIDSPVKTTSGIPSGLDKLGSSQQSAPQTNIQIYNGIKLSSDGVINLFGTREFCDSAKYQFQNWKIKKQASLFFLDSSDFAVPNNIIVISANNKYSDLPNEIKTIIPEDKYNSLNTGGYILFNLERSVVLILK